jgi:hypothetical protein
MRRRVGQVVQPVDLVAEDDLHLDGAGRLCTHRRLRAFGRPVEEHLELRHPPTLSSRRVSKFGRARNCAPGQRPLFAAHVNAGSAASDDRGATTTRAGSG